MTAQSVADPWRRWLPDWTGAFHPLATEDGVVPVAGDGARPTGGLFLSFLISLGVSLWVTDTAIQQDRAGWFLLLLVVALATRFFTVWVATLLIELHRGRFDLADPSSAGMTPTADAPRERRIPRRIVYGVGAMAAGLAIAGAATIIEQGWVADLGLTILTIGIVLATKTTSEVGANNSRFWLIVGLVAVIAPMILFFLAGDSRLFLLLIFYGIAGTVVKVGMAGWLNDESVRKRSLSVLAAAPFVALIPALIVTRAEGMFVVIGVLLGSLLLSICALAAAQLVPSGMASRPGTHGWWTIFVLRALGFGLTAVGAVLLASMFSNSVGFTLVLFFVPFVFGLFYVLRGESVVVVLLLGALLAWVYLDRTVLDEAPTDPTGTLVAFGDSFVSGEGDTVFFTGTNTSAKDGVPCRRSPNAYPERVGRALGMSVQNVACSGATTSDIWDVGQHPDRTDVEVADLPGTIPQTEWWETHGGEADLVLVSIGGNDTEFSSAVAGCLLPSNCDGAFEDFAARAAAIGTRLDRAYGEIARVTGDAPILVVTYPNFVGSVACDTSLTEAEVAFAASFVSRLNGAVIAATTRMQRNDLIGDRFHLFTDMPRAYENHTLCDEEPGANFIQVVPKAGTVGERLFPLTWLPGSSHPNAIGHGCASVAIVEHLERDLGFDRIDDPDDCELADLVPVSAVAPALNTGAECVILDPNSEGDDDPDLGDRTACIEGGPWLVEQVADFSGLLFGALVFVVLGGILLALGFLPVLPRAVTPRVRINTLRLKGNYDE